MQHAAVVIRHFPDERTTPEEEQAWQTWQAQYPEDAQVLTTLRQETLALLGEARALAARAARALGRTPSPCAGPKVTL